MFIAHYSFLGQESSLDLHALVAKQSDHIDGEFEFFRTRYFSIVYTRYGNSIYHSYSDGATKILSSTVFFSGRIYNVDKLRAELKGYLSDETDRGLQESQIIQACIKKWGKPGFGKILGDWVAAIIDHTSNEIVLCKDHYGISSVYYHISNSEIIFTDSLKSFKRSFPNLFQNLNKDRIISELANYQSSDNECYYKEIFWIPSGHYFHKSDGAYCLKRYWYPFDKPSLIYPNFNDYYEHFVELFNTVIAERVNPNDKIGIFLSGGLDSGAILSLLSIHLERFNKELYSYTSIPQYDEISPDHLIFDESERVKYLVNKYKNVNPTFINAGVFSPFQAIKHELEEYGEPVVGAGNLFWILNIFERAQKDGVNTLFVGQNGNTTISWPFRMISKQYYKNQFIRLIRSKYRYITEFLSKSYSRNQYIDIYSKELLINKRHIVYESISMKRSIEDRSNRFLNTEFRKHTLLQRSLMFGKYWKSLSNRYGIHVTDPTSDPRIIEFCNQIPYKLYYHKQGDRALLRMGMKDYFPEQYYNDRRHGVQSADIIRRLTDEQETLKETIYLLKENRAIAEILNIEKMEQWSNQCLNAQSRDIDSLVRIKYLLRALMSGIQMKSI